MLLSLLTHMATKDSILYLHIRTVSAAMNRVCTLTHSMQDSILCARASFLKTICMHFKVGDCVYKRKRTVYIQVPKYV